MALVLLAVLAVAAYWPVFGFPFISDDFGQIALSRVYGPVSGWPQLAHDPGFRLRFTYVELSFVLDRLFGFHPLPFYAASVVLHAVCAWLVYALGSWRLAGWRLAFPAAAFFAVYDGHQEAVMWAAASMELLLFLFGVGAFLAWLRWLDGGGPG